jgi:hypothetical protein
MNKLEGENGHATIAIVDDLAGGCCKTPELEAPSGVPAPKIAV